MEQNKRKLIVREIEQWREGKLLPEHYCDFLLNLYDERPERRDTKRMGISKQAVKNSNWKIWLLGTMLTALVAYVLLYFNSFPFPMQMAAVVAFVAGSFSAGIAVSPRNRTAGYAFAGIGSMVLLGAGVYLLWAYELDEAPLLIAYVALCSFVWILVGLGMRMGVFHYCGWIGLLLVYAWLLGERTELGWLGAQLGWLPLCVLFGWLGWLLHRANKTTGAVLLLVAFTLWWMPEPYLLYTGRAALAIVQLLLLAKLAIAGIVLFGWRKKWTEWVF